jgi:predicted ATPase/transcriptional regulator with XRE-family HTH domain
MSVPRGHVTFGSLVREHRLAANLTQEALAERSGVSPRTIQEVESGSVHPRRGTAQSLIQALNLLVPDQQELERLAMLTPRRRATTASPHAVGSSGTITPIRDSEEMGDEAGAGRPRVTLARSASITVPSPISRLIGRENDLAAIRELFAADRQRLVTLTGVGGSGKTRLAIQAATDLERDFVDGVWWVELAPVSSAGLVPRIVAGSIGLPEVLHGSVFDTMIGALQHKRLLLVLDNCEHLIEACAELANRLLTACPDLSVLATSREPLQIPGERRWQVRALAVPAIGDAASPEVLVKAASVGLFVERAQSIDDTFALTTSNALAVAQVCARLDGIPLAIELAASRIGVLSAGQIAERLGDDFRVLSRRMRGGPTRQQTMEAALAWSYDLLTPSEQTAFRSLSTFAGGFDLEAAGHVCGGQSDVLDVLGSLVDKSLVVTERTQRGHRYRLLEPVRQYAALALVTGGESELARTRHAAYYAALAERAEPLLHGPEQVAWLDRLEREQDNLRAALAWTGEHGTVDARLQLAIALSRYWASRGYLVEGRRWLQAVLAASEDGGASPVLRMRALLKTGLMAKWQGDLDAGRRLLAEAVTAARDLGERRDEAEALNWLSTVHSQMDDFEVGLRLGEESRRLGHEIGDEEILAYATTTLGVALRYAGENARAVGLLEDGLDRFRVLGDQRYGAMAMTELGLALLAAGDHDRAEPLIRQCLHECRVIGEQRYVIYGLLGLVEVYQQKGELHHAARLLRVADVQRESIGMQFTRFNRSTAQRLFDSLRQQLTPAELDAAYASGDTTSLDQVLAEIDATP